MVLDFANDADTIEKSFQTYYKTTLLAKETDPIGSTTFCRTLRTSTSTPTRKWNNSLCSIGMRMPIEPASTACFDDDAPTLCEHQR